MSGYLGKISALVTVNTGDFRSKLEGAAKDVQGFARSVQTNITSASRDAAKAFKDIYTPLQQFERSLRAASSMKLSFTGFPGAIKDVETLRQRLATLNNRQVDVILRTSGLKNITQFRDAIYGLENKTLDLAVRVGGLDRLRELRDSILEGDNRIEVAVEAKEALERLQSLRQQIEEVKKNPVTVPAGGVEQATARLKEAENAMKAFVMAASGGRRVKASGFLSDLQDQVVAGEQKLEDLRGKQRQREELLAGATTARQRSQINRDRPDRSGEIAAVEQEVAGLSKAISELQGLTAQYKAARENLAQVKSAAGGGPRRELERAAREQEAEAKRLLEQAQGKISARLGFQIDTKGVESLLSGGVVSQVEKLQSALNAAGVSGGDAATMIGRVMSALGTSDLNATTTQLQQLTSAAELVAKPLQGIKQNLAAAGKDIEAAFLPSLANIQSRAESLKTDIENLAKSGESEAPALLRRINSELASIQQELDSATAATNRFVEASSKIGQFKTGRELAFAAPALSDALARGQRAGEAAMGLPSSAIQANPQIAEGVIRIRTAADEAAEAYARLEAATADGLPLNITTARENLDIVLRKYLELVEASEREVTVVVNTDQARKNLAELASRFLNVDQRESELLSNQGASTPLGPDRLAGIERDRQFREQQAERAADAQRRAEAASRFLPVNQQESDLISNQGASSDVRDRLAGIERDRQFREQQAERAADARRRAEAASRFLPVNQQESDLLSNEGLATRLGPDYLREGLDRKSRSALGPELGDANRQIDRFGQSINSIKGQLDALPGPMRSHFIPAIAQAEQEFMRLRALGPQATAQEIEDATNNLRSLEAAAKRATTAFSFESNLGGRGAQDLELNLQSRSLSGYQAQLQVLQQTLGTVSSEARGPAVASFMRLQQAISQAFQDGTLDAANTRREIDRLTQDAVEATAQVAGVGRGGLGRRVARAGDVGRGGVDNFSLGLNQAIFAIDDFMSSTGGMEFKLRAISNNITQLGFIVGGTTGLIAGLAAVIGGQIAVALVKWANNGQTAEDRIKALNDALARQKSLVEELAAAYRSLGDSLSRGTMSPSGEQAADFERQLDDIRNKQQESVRRSVSDFDPAVVRERAEQRKIQNEINASTDAGEIVGLQQQLEVSRQREKAAADAAEAAPPPAMESVQRAMKSTFERMANAAAADEMTFAGLDPQAAQMAAERARRPLLERAAAVELPADPIEARNAVTSLIEELSGQIDSGIMSDYQAAAARQQLLVLKGVLSSLEAPVRRALNEAANKIFEASRGPAEQIRQAQEEVAKALELGIAGAGEFAAQLQKNAEELRQAYKNLEAAAEETDPDKKAEKTKAAQEAIDRVKDDRNAVLLRAERFRAERMIDPQRLIDARLSRAGSNLSDSGLGEGRLARAAREIEFQRETIRLARAMPENQTVEKAQELDKQDAALNEQAAALEAATIAVKLFGDALNRASEEVKSNLQSAENAADQARRADLGGSTARSREERAAAEADLERQREVQREAQDQVDNARARMEENAFNQAGAGQSILDRKRELEEGNAIVRDAYRIHEENRAAGVDTGTITGDAEALDAKGLGRLANQNRDLQRRMVQFRGDSGGSFWDKIKELWNGAAALQAEADSTFADEFARIQEINEELAGGDASAAQQAELRAERARLEAAVEPERKRIEAEAQAAVEASTREEEQRQSAARGRELRMTPAQRAAEDVAQGLEDIRQAFGREAESGTGLIDLKGQQEAQRRFLDDQIRAAAPGLANLADQVQNAVIQGPSRASLQATDASSVEGMRELDRLLRGDTGVDENIVELQKQTQVLEGIKTAVEEMGGAPILNM